ncbi:MAG: cobalamin-binding protein [Candidatus Omnitrophica bacterium]|nr:cobalamin-binding protein [Candidatus Omnitrophota bacterium]MCM8793035.1 cobalamin-binding protein [Candidatus Omnitrophota bacterium]
MSIKERFFILVLMFFISPEVKAQDLRIVSLAPNTTEILFALDLGKNIVGVDIFSNYPEEAKKIEKVGSFSHPNLEKIVSLKPDFVFITGLEQNPFNLKLRRLGLRVFTVDPQSIKELFQDVLQIGKITHKEERAKTLVREMEKELAEIKEKVKNKVDRPKVFLEIWDSPLITCGRNSYIEEMISLAGGINIAHNLPRKFSRISQEQVIKNSPEVIIVSHMQNNEGMKKSIGKRWGWQIVEAIKKDRIYADIDPDIILRPGPRIIAGIKELYRRFYGEDLY